MINIAILGFGIVGGGVAEVIDENQEKLKSFVGDNIYVKKILDLRRFPESKYNDRITSDINDILNDDSIGIVVETMGGIHPAYEFSIAAMEKGKNVVTSNKAVLAQCGIELNKAARDNNVSYEFEASVGGGIPVIRSLRTSLASDDVTKIDAIINGTTNFILTSMKNDNKEFGEALKEAQALGYAEKDPTADIEGYDPQRKMMILTALATNKLMKEEQIYHETITKVSMQDMDAADRLGGAVKYVASMKIEDGKLSAYVCPRIIPNENMLSHVEDVYNGITVTCKMNGELFYYGKGAGRYPTASAVVSDVAAIACGMSKKELKCPWESFEHGTVKEFGENMFKYYVRFNSIKIDLSSLPVNMVLKDSPDGKLEIVTDLMYEKDAKVFYENEHLESLIRLF